MTDVWGPPRYLDMDREIQNLSGSDNRSTIWDLTVCVCMCTRVCVCVCRSVRTIDGKHIFYLLLYDLQAHFNPIRLCHGVDLVGVQSVDVQDLEGE